MFDPKQVHPEDAALVDRWFAARKAWSKEMRVKYEKGDVLLDSPKLCEDAAIRAWSDPPYEGELPTWEAESWTEWAAVRDLVLRDSKLGR